MFLAVYYLILSALFLAGAEIILRLRGVNPWRPRDLVVRVNPGGHFFTKHPTLGYSHIPGKFTVTLGADYSFRVTHLPNTLRVTHPIGSYGTSRPMGEIWIFGCSITHGWSLDDEQTYPWLLQERLPDYEVVNFGVSGYGTTHSLLQFKEALQAKRPKVAVLAYGDLHDIRNTFARQLRKHFAPWNKLGPLQYPYARIDGSGTLRYSMGKVEYREFPLMRCSALVHFIEQKYNNFEERCLRIHLVSEALVEEMARLAKEREVKLVVAGITDSRGTLDMLKFAKEHGIASVDISVDLRVKENTNLPHDGHPSAVANKKYADKLEAYLRAEILNEGIRSDRLERAAQPETAVRGQF